jgi:hypothetical protein
MNNKQLSILPANKTTVFYSPIEGKDVLVRTGIINEGSSFIHSCLHCYSQEYIRMSDKEKISSAEKLCRTISDKIQTNLWNEKFNIANMIEFQDALRTTLKDFYKCVNGPTNTISNLYNKLSNDIEPYKIICQIVKLENFTKEILPETYNFSTNKPFKDFKEELKRKTTYFSKKIFDTIGDTIEKKRKKYCIDKVINLSSELADEVHSVMLQKHLEYSKDLILEIDSTVINFISDILNRNIYILDTVNRMPSKIPDVSHNNKKSIILLCIGEYRYEPVGRLLEKNRIQRDFSDQQLIKDIHTFLYNPKIIPKKYPHLAKYINPRSLHYSTEKSRSSSKSQCSSSSRSSSSKSSSRSSSKSSSRSSSRSSSKKSSSKRIKYRKNKSNSSE